MLVIDFIKANGLEALSSLSVEVRDYPDRVVLNYSHIDSPRFSPIIDECRALILRKGTWKVLARSFDRFYNLGEIPPERKTEEDRLIADPNLEVLEKVDGSLISVYHDGENWCCSTRSMAFAEGQTARRNSFKDVFERALGCTVADNFHDADPSNTYVFEMVSPETRIVKPYPTDDVYLLTVRNNETGNEWTLDQVGSWANDNDFRVPQRYKFNNTEEILRSMHDLHALDEGYVARLDLPGRVWRTKIKNPAYLAISNLRPNGVVSDKRLAVLVLGGSEAEYLGYFPEDTHLFEPYRDARKKMIELVNTLWEAHRGIESQKEFAMKVKDTPVSHVLFSMRKGGLFQDIVDKMPDDGKLGLLQRLLKA